MANLEDFIQNVFQQQYEEVFGSEHLEKLNPQDYYLTSKRNGELAAVLHAQQVLDNIHIKGLAVENRHQGQGLGAQLLRELEQLAVEKGVESITLSTKSYQAKDFYLKQGYEIYASLEDVPQKGVTKYHLIKRLNLKNT